MIDLHVHVEHGQAVLRAEVDQQAHEGCEEQESSVSLLGKQRDRLAAHGGEYSEGIESSQRGPVGGGDRGQSHERFHFD